MVEIRGVALAGVVVGAMGGQVLQAQTSPRAYLVAEVQVTDADAYRPYIPKAAEIDREAWRVNTWRGAVKTESLEGAEAVGRIGIVQFPSMAELKKFTVPPSIKKWPPPGKKHPSLVSLPSRAYRRNAA